CKAPGGPHCSACCVCQAEDGIRDRNVTGVQTWLFRSMQGQYQEYIVTKTGYLITILSGTGVNLDLLNEYEQTDIFDEYNAFLMRSEERRVGKEWRCGCWLRR